MSKPKIHSRPRTQTWADVYKPSEEVVQQHITAALRAKRLRVLSTVHRVKMCECPQCHTRFRPKGNYGTDKGVPDLLVRRDDWQKAGWMAQEVKGAKTALSVEQKELQKSGAIVVVRSVEEALAALAEFEGQLEDE